MTHEVQERLRARGLRATVSRVAVLRVLEASDDHPRVEQVIDRVRASGVSISTQAAYDVCDALREASLARRIQPADSPARYEARVGDNHHHVVCRGCGTTADVDCATGRAPCLAAAQTHGFAIDEAEVTYWGLCPACKAPADETKEPAHGR
ncbi:MAG: transcriptional repressor [Solirubrobacterales bacterium]|nr:transcriptional repressor [Solirubrobacterales bacterium]